MTAADTAVSAAAPPRRRARRIGGWAILVVALAVVGVGGAILSQSGQWSDRAPLDPESTGSDGARAIARVLEAEGVDVQIVRDRAAALNALDGDETLLMPDAPALSDDAISELASRAGDVVLAEPRARTLRLLLFDSSPAGAAPDEPLAPACPLPAAERAGDIVAGDLYAPGDGVLACYPADDGYALLSSTSAGQTVTAIDARALLANENVTRAGNAALSLTLLGARPTLVWYMPGADGDATDAAPTLGELTPEWVTPAIVLLILGAVGAGIWRGRRFGPLVAENLPVTVRASETTVGRGRLYARSRDAAHALDQLRAAALPRLAGLLGLAATALPGDIADAAAARLGIERTAVRSILIDARPHDDRALVDLSERLTDLEARVRAAVRPEGNTP